MPNHADTDFAEVGRSLLDMLPDCLASRSGRLLYSHPSTIRPSPIYVLGYNPGGDPEQLSDSICTDHGRVCANSAPWSAYVDECWGRSRRPGKSPLQRRMGELLKPDNECDVKRDNLRKIPASNLIFVRSKSRAFLEGPNKLIELCWPVHEEIIRRVRPHCIVAFGMETFEQLMLRGRSLGMQEDKAACLHGGSGPLRKARSILAGHEMTVLGIHHLSRYAIDAERRKDGPFAWARRHIADARRDFDEGA